MATFRQGYDRDRDGPTRGADFAGRTTSVFVGNLPYDCTEQQLIETFSTVGSVSNARLVFDHLSGKMKGFGFVEFYDPDTASSAVRNLNGSDFAGRQLRVDHAEPDSKNPPGRPGGPPPAAAAARPGAPPVAPKAAAAAAAAAVPSGISLAPGQSATDAISQTLATIPPAQLMEILSQMKGLVTQSPDKARNLLNEQPQLAYALFQAMLMMKIVDGNILVRMVANNQQGAAAPVPAGFGAAAPPPPQPQLGYPAQGQMGGLPTAPDPYGGFRAPPAQMAPAAFPSAPAAAPGPDQSQLQQALQAALRLTNEQVLSLPEETRRTVMQLRQQYGIR